VDTTLQAWVGGQDFLCIRLKVLRRTFGEIRIESKMALRRVVRLREGVKQRKKLGKSASREKELPSQKLWDPVASVQVIPSRKD